MAYSIESTTARRCTTNLNGQQCGLAEHHVGDHVAPDGRQRWAGYPIFGALAEAWGDRLGGTSVAAVLADRINAVAQRVESETPLREALESRLDALERALSGNVLENHRIRLEKLEKALRDTHDLAERAATQHLERKPDGESLDRVPGLARWDARSPEPPRDQTYVDGSGALWRFFNGNGWQGTPPGTKWDPHGGGYTWDELCNSRKNLSRPDFPWKVCTNG